ncbi:EAL domain-containing protein [Rhodobacterales bacterium HKCCE3408]|nr:EAL domain-containing protein [Rhodobacterales bacterium HKCCE3408]
MMRTGGRVADPETGSPLAVALHERSRKAVDLVGTALDCGNARLAFQPVVAAVGNGRAAFHEGLIRMIDPRGRTIPAGDFMNKVEDLELGRLIDCRALSLGLKVLKKNPGIRLAINMSARSIGYPQWMAILRRHVRSHPDAVERLILEITESSAMMMPELVIRFMAEQQQNGITFALDDFGAGYTAFRHLRDFSFDILKIDGQFVRGIGDNADNQVLVSALLSIAQHFDMLTVAESVETEAEADWLVRAGADCLQGYLYGAPTMRPIWPDRANIAASA